MSLPDSLLTLRRFLRDPDGDVHTMDDLITYWNDAQREIAQKTAILERVEANRYPPRYDWAYLWDWERTHTDGDRRLGLTLHMPSSRVMCYPWEAAYWLATVETQDEGTRIIQPWESAYCSTSDVIQLPIHRLMDTIKHVAFDEEQVTPISERELATNDPYYRTRSGEVSSYYIPNDYDNQMVLYPRPGTVVFQEVDDSDIYDDLGGLVDVEGDTNTDETGLTTDIISTADALFIVYSFLPTDIQNFDAYDNDWPDWLLKYVEYATLERAFGADTDGFIPSLRDYWKQRKEIGIQAVKRFMRMRMADRDYQMGGVNRPTRGRGPSLPAGYPSI